MAPDYALRQIESIENGTVIDHIPADKTLQVARLVASPDDQVFIGVNFRSHIMDRKGVVKVSDRELSPAAVSRLSLLAPNATISIIRNSQVAHKSKVPVPDAFTGIAKCPNANCITNSERWTTTFEVVSREPLRVHCHFCERVFPAADLEVV